ncbi:RlmE family RNA methyltransferase [Deferribacter autotrophicus]|uniref:Ribosomal RNA large subunit methyltransferase E n=1 Tax=Deferribacter autotrophicus TaxID=500465 RepID=A0A5A8F7E9_9BACT|nr:RlmE family RNA methyltransferase [Deferribacter autotrophicus]KAA0258948.1 RlmE family RNA methyltransferase [Deferribacter autotrophicus]
MYKRKDAYYKKAKKEGFKSRAAYKLIEINNKYQLIKKGDVVLDAGCAPGGWSQAVLTIVGKKGLVVGIDILPVEGITFHNFHFIQGNLLDAETLNKVLDISRNFDTVISDAAPNTTGQKITDHVNSLELVKTILSFAEKVLKKGGNFLFKLFDGEDRDEFIKLLKTKFSTIKIIRPDATRKSSFEIYVVCKGYKGE